MRFGYPVLVLAGLLPMALPAQLAPDGSRLRARVDTMVSYLIADGDTVLTGMMIDELERVTVNGREVLRRVTWLNDRALGSSLDTIIDDPVTLAPIRWRSRSLGGIANVNFDAGIASGFFVPANGDTIPINHAVPTPIHASATFDLVLRSSPLAAGWRASVPVFMPSSRTVLRMNARVEALVRIDGRSCWHVEGEFSGMSVGFWIDTTTRDLCQMVMRPRSDLSILYRPAPPPAREGGRLS